VPFGQKRVVSCGPYRKYLPTVGAAGCLGAIFVPHCGTTVQRPALCHSGSFAAQAAAEGGPENEGEQAERGEAVVMCDVWRVISTQACGEQKKQIAHMLRPSMGSGCPRRTPVLTYG